MSTDLPFRMRVHAERAPSQLGFAIQASSYLEPTEAYRLDATRSGLVVYALSEPDLAEVKALLIDGLGAAFNLVFACPAVALRRQSGMILQPILHLRIRACRQSVSLLLHELMERLAQVLEVEYQGDDVIVRTQAPAMRLLGFHSNLTVLAGSRVEMRCQVVRYEPVE